MLHRLRRLLRSGKPGVRDQTAWNQQYAEGQWDFLGSMEEMARYWIAAGYCSNFDRPAILDVGCGPCLLEPKLRLLPYKSYMGVDFSIEALKQARRRLPESCGLVCADLGVFETSASFDVIAFMELAWQQPLTTVLLKRYAQRLRPEGRLLLSQFDGRDRRATISMWQEIRANFEIEDITRVENLPSEKRWTVAWIRP